MGGFPMYRLIYETPRYASRTPCAMHRILLNPKENYTSLTSSNKHIAHKSSSIYIASHISCFSA